MEKVRKPYEKPTATKLTPQQAKQKLLGLADRGNETSKKFMEMISAEQGRRTPKIKKKSA